MIPPTVTAQEKGETIIKGKIHHYIKPEVREVADKFKRMLSQKKPEKPYKGAVRLITKWCYPITKGHLDGEYKTTKPDTDNSLKLLKDCMTDIGFWEDDSQVASEITEKFWAMPTGIYIRVESLD